MVHVALGDDCGYLVQHRREQVHRPPVGLSSAAFGLAVHGQGTHDFPLVLLVGLAGTGLPIGAVAVQPTSAGAFG